MLQRSKVDFLISFVMGAAMGAVLFAVNATPAQVALVVVGSVGFMVMWTLIKMKNETKKQKH